MRAVSRQQQLHPEQREHGVRQLPPEGFPGHDAAKPRAVRILTNLYPVPQHDIVDGREL